jgi:hypothetical protein
MPDTSLPKPLSAYVGLLVASFEEARAGGHSTAGQVARLPLAAAGQLLTARTRYDELAQTGDMVVDVVVGMVRQRFGSSQEEATAWIGDELSSAAKATEQVAEKFSGGADKAASTVTSLSGSRSQPKKARVKPPTTNITEAIAETVTAPVAEALEKAAERVAATAAAIEPEPDVVVSQPAIVVVEPELDLESELAPEPQLAPKPTPMQQLEQFSVPEEIGKQAGGLKTAADLPLPDFDHMSAPQLRGRLRKLDRVQLVQLLDYERAHADRVGIILLLENRLAKMLAAGEPTV